MITTPHPSAALEFAIQVEGLYAAMIAGAVAENLSNSAPHLGGKLLYAGKLDVPARALVVAANIAGAASLAATADPDARKQAFRDGVVDFLVTSLDEALRILKNEIRKRQTVAVCVAAAPDSMAEEMRERGVVPDLAPPFKPVDARVDQLLLAWSVASAPALWLPKLDDLALQCLEEKMSLEEKRCAPEPAEEGLASETLDAAHRWLRLAPRYLGRPAQDIRMLRCDETAARRFQQRALEAVARGEIGVRVEFQSFSLPAASIRAQSSFTP